MRMRMSPWKATTEEDRGDVTPSCPAWSFSFHHDLEEVKEWPHGLLSEWEAVAAQTVNT